MYFCGNCGAPYEDSNVPAVCSSCGHPLKTENAAPAFTPAAPVYAPAPQVDKGAKVMSIIGMVIGIAGAVELFISLFFAFIPHYSGFVSEIVFAIFNVGGAIAALILGNKAYTYGYREGTTTAARVLGKIGIIGNAVVFGISFFLFILGCAGAFGYSFWF